MPDKNEFISEKKVNNNTKRKKIIKTAIISIFSLLIVAVLGIATVYMLWKNGAFIPGYVTWNNQSDTFSIEKNMGSDSKNANDTHENVDFQLAKKHLKITDHDSGEVLYESPREWKVSDYFYADIDSDDDNEVIMMVWKQGSFGEHKPFWHKGKDNKWTQHIFIFEWDSERDDRLDPKWMSSGLGIKVHNVYIDEKNRVHFIAEDGEETIWQWLGWGLTLVQVIN